MRKLCIIKTDAPKLFSNFPGKPLKLSSRMRKIKEVQIYIDILVRDKLLRLGAIHSNLPSEVRSSFKSSVP